MLNKITAFINDHKMISAGDCVICAFSGGADSMALLFAMYLLADKLQIHLEAAHFNHHLRGEESNRDEAFVKEFCSGYHIPLHLGSGEIIPGEKGLEAAAREARYAFFRTLEGKIATAHTADDNAETLLMHLIRGTGLKGLTGITPVGEQIIRPMLTVTRDEVENFLAEYHLDWVSDSSNHTDEFMRNRIRHHVIPLLKQENPSIVHNLSATALRLREENSVIESLIPNVLPDVNELCGMTPGFRARVLSHYLYKCGVHDIESRHILALEKLVFSPKPSASANFPGGITIRRNYNRLEMCSDIEPINQQVLTVPCVVELFEPAVRIHVRATDQPVLQQNCFTVYSSGEIYLRSRMPGDKILLSGGSKDLKKLYIDRKIPLKSRCRIPVLADSGGVLGVFGFGANLSRTKGEGTLVEIRFEEI